MIQNGSESPTEDLGHKSKCCNFLAFVIYIRKLDAGREFTFERWMPAGRTLVACHCDFWMFSNPWMTGQANPLEPPSGFQLHQSLQFMASSSMITGNFLIQLRLRHNQHTMILVLTHEICSWSWSFWRSLQFFIFIAREIQVTATTSLFRYFSVPLAQTRHAPVTKVPRVVCQCGYCTMGYPWVFQGK